MSNPETVAVYARVSSEDQKESGTINAQLDFARRYCELHSLTVYSIYADDGVTGTIALAERPEGKRLLEDAKAKHFQVVLVLKIDRLARSLWHLLNAYNDLSAIGVGIRSMTEPLDTSSPIGRFVFQLLGSIAELERETIRDRLDLGRRRAIREARWIGGAPPFGYRVEDKRLAVAPSEAAVVRRIFDLYVEEGLGLRGVVDLLNAEAMPTPWESRGTSDRRRPTKGGWSTGTIANLLHAPVYRGQFPANHHGKGPVVEYPAPAIIDPALWEAAQQTLRDRFIEASRNARRLYLLRGMMTCHCGKAISGAGGKRGIYYYSCREGHFFERADTLENAVWSQIEDYARHPGKHLKKLQARLRAQVREEKDLSGEMGKLDKALALKRTEQNSVIALFRRGRISEAQLDVQLGDVDREIVALESRQQALLSRQSQAQIREFVLLSTEQLLGKLGEKVTEARDHPERQRELIKALVERIVLDSTGKLTVHYAFKADCLANRRAMEKQSGHLEAERVLQFVPKREYRRRMIGLARV